MSKSLFDRVKNKKVRIVVKSFSTVINTVYEGAVIAYYFGQGTEMFIELDLGEIINTRYIESITIIE